MPKQSGFALILLLTLIVISTTSFLVVKIDPFQFKLNQQKQKIRALAQAKQALLGFALTYGDVKQGQMPGYLPCPDKTDNGSANSPCLKKGEHVSGQLPWRTLALPPQDFSYEVSGNYKNNPKQILTNNTDIKIIATIDSKTFITPKDFEPIYQTMNDWVGNRVLECLHSYAKQNGNKYPTEYSDEIEWTIDPHLTEDKPENSCFNENAGLDDWQWGWWKKWKQKVFFATNKILTTSTITINLPVIVLVATTEQNNEVFNYLQAKNLDEKILTTNFKLNIYY